MELLSPPRHPPPSGAAQPRAVAILPSFAAGHHSRMLHLLFAMDLRGCLGRPRAPRPTATDDALSLLSALPNDLQLHVCEALTDHHERAALCLAEPRVGLAAMRTLSGYKDRFLAVAIALRTHGSAAEVLDEAFYRRYAAALEATAESCAWLAEAAERAGWPLHVAVISFQPYWLFGIQEWRLRSGAREVALLRRDHELGASLFYEGEAGAERLVRRARWLGIETFYEGEQGAERKVRATFRSGAEWFYEGEKDAERLVCRVHPSGEECFYEGEAGVEHKVRSVLPSGEERFYEGEKGTERMVRSVLPDFTKRFYEGEMSAERMVRAVWPDGTEVFLEGDKGAERIVHYDVLRRSVLRLRG